jgi:maleate isomerase
MNGPPCHLRGPWENGSLAHVTQKDNWGFRARFGLFIVGNEAVPEAEWWAMAPTGVSVHAARVTARAPWATWHADRSGVDLADDLLRGARQFAAMRLSAVTLGHTSSSVIGGKGWDDAAVARVSAVVGDSMVVTTNGLDTLAALKAAGVKRPFLVLPPWFGDDTVKAAVGYYADHGVAPAGRHRYDPGAKWRHLAPADLVSRGLGFEQEIEPLAAQIRAGCPKDADGVLIAGTGFRCVAILETLEQELKRPVISANQASLWHCLRLSGVKDAVAGYGKLLSL